MCLNLERLGEVDTIRNNFRIMMLNLIRRERRVSPWATRGALKELDRSIMLATLASSC